jgi:DNA-binding LacI/PurR family transcriptional regulator
MTATIYDVATRAGVSIATVSRVLNAPQSVNSMTRARVQTVIDDLGFIPKAEATARARRRHRQVGVLVPFFTYSSFVQRLRGIAAALLDAGFELVVYNAETPEHVRAYLLSLPVTRRLDGLIIISLRIDQEASRRLVDHNLPAVLIETQSNVLSCVDIDNHAGGVLAAEYLLQKGHLRIGFVGGDREIEGYTWHTSELRLAGFRQRLQQAGLEPTVADMAPNTASPEEAHRQALALLESRKPPSAIFAASDSLALGVLRAARDRNVHVPDELAVLGFDNLDFSEFVGLSTISQSLEMSGRQAVELLLAAMADPQPLTRHVQTPLRLVQRNTT